MIAAIGLRSMVPIRAKRRMGDRTGSVIKIKAFLRGRSELSERITPPYTSQSKMTRPNMAKMRSVIRKLARLAITPHHPGQAPSHGHL